MGYSEIEDRRVLKGLKDIQYQLIRVYRLTMNVWLFTVGFGLSAWWVESPWELYVIVLLGSFGGWAYATWAMHELTNAILAYDYVLNIHYDTPGLLPWHTVALYPFLFVGLQRRYQNHVAYQIRVCTISHPRTNQPKETL